MHGLPHAAGLNPRAFRRRFARTPKPLGGGDARTRPLKASCILDGALLALYPGLDYHRQLSLAGSAAHRVQLLSDLAELGAAIAAL